MIYGRDSLTHDRNMGGLMKIMPVISVFWVISGLASLGLPGFSGFVSEMTIFTGAFQYSDPLHRTLTIIACSSIVITAVYILRVVGKMLGLFRMSIILSLTDASKPERVAMFPCRRYDFHRHTAVPSL